MITGSLNLSSQDALIQGAIPIPIVRTYSSSGALERSKNNTDLLFKAVRQGWVIQGGWSLFPHENLLIQTHADRTAFKVHLSEPNGSSITYAYSHIDKASKHIIVLKPTHSISQSSGKLSSRNNPQNNLLKLDLKAGSATLFLPDGGSRTYRGPKLHHLEPGGLGWCYYLLSEEKFPSGHQLRYIHSEKSTHLERIESRNPSGTKIYAAVDIEYIKQAKDKPFSLQFKATDGKQFQYFTIQHESREYLSEFHSNCRPKERFHLVPGRKGIGARLSSIEVAGKEPFKVEYYLPSNKEQERKWAKSPHKKETHIDKVEKIIAPVGANGEDVTVAHFTYFPNHTDAYDAEELLTRYHHDSGRITLIEYFNEKNQLTSSQKFYWKGTELRCKAMFDEMQQPLFAKTFTYEDGNVIEEVLWGYFTGEEAASLKISSDGTPSGGERYRKTYTYYKDRFNLLKTESEEDGPTYEYFYKPETDLCSLKLTKDKQGKTLIREFSTYNDDNFLTLEIIDDGTTQNPEDKIGVTQRLEKTYELNPLTSLPDCITESYWDPVEQAKKLLKKTKYTYLNHKVHTEEIFDSSDKSRYTLTTDYDQFGLVKRKTTPLNKENTYLYTPQGSLKESKEVGSSKKIFHYDRANRPNSCEEPSTGKITRTTYDVKGRVLTQTDFKSNQTTHTYDSFGNRKTTKLPACKDEEGQKYNPTPKFEYDVQGNLISAEMPLKEKTQTSYNIFRKPTLIIQADGTEIRHIYNKNGTLSKTLYPDQTEVRFSYDLFKRITSQTTYSKEKKQLLSESWTYSAFQPLTHTDARGLKTLFFYDAAGRKISEEAEDRKATFTYDPLGYLEKTDNGFVALIQKHNIEGLIEEQWELDTLGRIENKMQFIYDHENRKEKVIRITSQGEATDLIAYKDGKISQYTDPNKDITQFLYDEFFENDLGQKVLQKTTLDPLGISTIETMDAGERLISREKKDSQGRTVFKEEFLYTRSGNRAKRISHIYKDNELLKQISTTWEYDTMGRITSETESGQKTTTYTYDIRGRLEWKTLPSGIRLHYTYDGANRLQELSSLDRKIHYQYHYKEGPDPYQITDLVQGTTLTRSYNAFGQLTSETDQRNQTSTWTYDAIGRCISFTLPDQSSIHYPSQGAHITAVQRKSPRGNLLYEHQYRNFDPNGHVSNEQLIYNIGSIQTTHDLLERPSTQSSPHLNQTISYGPSGLVTQTQNSLFGTKNCTYDALNQLKEEGPQTYHFDSIGNPLQFQVNDLNQISATPDATLTYDPDGNPLHRTLADTTIQYEFDPLGRLTDITTPQQKKVHYLYDPLSRLFAKEVYLYINNTWQKEHQQFYLYNQDHEIGTKDENGNLLELKVLGLGILGDIGAAIAIEINQTVYAPLHDFNGNIIALLSPDGTLSEKYEIDAFGKEKLSSTLNPWRFSSKRAEEGLVFFGLRFYDPSLGRWLSPDPAGYADGANLYAFVRNSPLNRLDLFGLASQDPFGVLQPAQITVQIRSIPIDNSLMSIRMQEGGVFIDYFLSFGHWHELKLTPHEEQKGSFNLFDHGELFSAKSRQIGIVSLTHGINVHRGEFKDACDFMIKNLEFGTLFIGRYHGTDGIFNDLVGTGNELSGVETSKVSLARNFMIAVSTALHKVNPAVFHHSGVLMSLGAVWAHFDHSRGGLIDKRAIQGMPYEQQKILQTQLLLVSVAPALPIAKNVGIEAVNYYSTQDLVTGGLGLPHVPASIFGVVGSLVTNSVIGHSDCDIRVIPCSSRWSERSFYLADHAFLGRTYTGAITKSIKNFSGNYGFYGEKFR